MYVLAYVIFFVYLCSRKGLETSRHSLTLKRNRWHRQRKKAGVASRRNTRRDGHVESKGRRFLCYRLAA